MSWTGKQISLRPMRLEERRQFFKWATCSESTPYWYGELYGDEIPTFTVFKHEWPDYYFDGSRPMSGRCFAILLKGEPIGQINYNEVDLREKRVNMDVLIPETHNHCHGYGSEAIWLLTRHIFQDLRLNICSIEVSPHNPKAIRAYEKVGFGETNRFVRDGITWVFMELKAENFVMV